MSAREPIEYAGVVASPDGLAEKGSRLRVPRAEIQSVEFLHGSSAQHPLWMFVFGVILVALGLYPLRRTYAWWFQGAGIMDVELLMVGFLVLGVYALWEAVKRVPLLLVRTTRGSRRLVFQKAVTREAVEDFLRRLESEFDYTVRSWPGDGP
jgi:hypothetical protein